MRKTLMMMIVSLIGLQARSETFSCRVLDAVITATDTTIVCLMDGEETEMDLPDGIRLRGIKAFGDGVIAITDGQLVLFWDSPFDKARKIRFDMKGNFISIDAGTDACHALSDCSEIISINLALQGKVFDFNAAYSTYYGNIRLIDIAAGPTSVFVAGVRDDGRPASFTSAKGSVWSERELNYRENGTWHMFGKVPHSITYQEASETFVLHCDDGTMFHIPACSHCNYVVRP